MKKELEIEKEKLRDHIISYLEFHKKIGSSGFQSALSILGEAHRLTIVSRRNNVRV